ncbi:MAG: hypothetical protein ACR2QB_00670 [Gammaproteobacteria bacterium]
MTSETNNSTEPTPTSVTLSTAVFAFAITMLGLLAMLGAVAVA